MWLLSALCLSLLVSLSASARPTLSETTQIAVDLKDRATVEAVTTELGKRYPELRQNFVLMHESQSRQAASYEFPRVISHTKDAQFTMAFNGEEGTKGNLELEMFEFDKATATFSFQRIQFHPGKAAVPQPVNEALCQKCHGKDLRPNWESYSRWPGAYPDTDTVLNGDKYHFGWKSVEHEAFDSFYTKQMGRGRYRFLDQDAVDAQFVIGKGNGGYHRVAPSHYTQIVAYLNYQRVARLLRATPDFARYQYAIAAALYDCPDFDEYLPADTTPHRTYAWYLTDTTKRFKGDINAFHHEHDYTQFAKFRYVLEGRGISLAKWSMNFRGNPYSFVTPGGSAAGFIVGLLMEQDDALKPYRVWNITNDSSYSITTNFSETWTGDSVKQNQPACDGLLKKSRELLRR